VFPVSKGFAVDWDRVDAMSYDERSFFAGKQEGGHELMSALTRLRELAGEVVQLRAQRAGDQHAIERLEAALTEAVAWFDEYRPQWGPGTLPIWYVDAKRYRVLKGKQ